MEELITFKTARLAKEKGFDWFCNNAYQYSLTESIDEQDGKSGPFGWEKGELSIIETYHINNDKDCDYSSENWLICSASTQSLLQKWLREVHNIYIEISVQEAEVVATWYWKIFKHREQGKGLIWIDTDSNGVVENTYEESLEKALQEGLNLIKNEKDII